SLAFNFVAHSLSPVIKNFTIDRYDFLDFVSCVHSFYAIDLVHQICYYLSVHWILAVATLNLAVLFTLNYDSCWYIIIAAMRIPLLVYYLSVATLNLAVLFFPLLLLAALDSLLQLLVVYSGIAFGFKIFKMLALQTFLLVVILITYYLSVHWILAVILALFFPLFVHVFETALKHCSCIFVVY
ncbi:hypothetical protein ACJX0J_013473, partial [Zea mays]